jgi:phage gp36-like protein
MSYASKAEMISRFGVSELIQLTDPPERTGALYRS